LAQCTHSTGQNLKKNPTINQQLYGETEIFSNKQIKLLGE